MRTHGVELTDPDVAPYTDAEIEELIARYPEIAELGLIVYTPEGFDLFLRMPQPRFGNQTALDLMASGHADQVYAALGSDHEGLGYQMWLDAYRRPLIGPVCRHIPDGSPFGPLDTRFATGATDNRWNDRAQPTLYLASAHEVLAVEWARHFPRDAVAQSGSRSRLRRVFDIDVALDHVLDLRDPSLCETIGLVNTPFCFVDKELCRATARRLRDATRAQGIVAPSLGMLDRADAWILVLIIDKLPGFPDQFVTAMTMDGAFGIAD